MMHPPISPKLPSFITFNYGVEDFVFANKTTQNGCIALPSEPYLAAGSPRPAHVGGTPTLLSTGKLSHGLPV